MQSWIMGKMIGREKEFWECTVHPKEYDWTLGEGGREEFGTGKREKE